MIHSSLGATGSAGHGCTRLAGSVGGGGIGSVWAGITTVPVLQDASTSTLAQLRLSAGQRLQCLLLVGSPLSNMFTVFLSGASHLVQATDGRVIVQGALNGALAQRIGGLGQLLKVVA
jgi:hypothetical protein